HTRWPRDWSSDVCSSDLNIHYAIGASLISVIATSSGAAAAYVRQGFSNIRIAMFLEIATTIGALFGAFLAARLAADIIAIVFGRSEERRVGKECRSRWRG